METSIIEILFKDGCKYRVFCANRKQHDKMILWHNKNKDKVQTFNFILNGIHTEKQFLTHFNK